MWITCYLIYLTVFVGFLKLNLIIESIRTLRTKFMASQWHLSLQTWLHLLCFLPVWTWHSVRLEDRLKLSYLPPSGNMICYGHAIWIPLTWLRCTLIFFIITPTIKSVALSDNFLLFSWISASCFLYFQSHSSNTLSIKLYNPLNCQWFPLPSK